MNFTKSLLDTMLLLFILSLGIAGYFSLRHQPMFQLLIVGLTALGYVIWGCWHHLRHGNFYWQVVIEYLLIAGLVVTLTASLLL